MTSVIQIRPAEAALVDHDQLEALYSDMGHASAEDVVCRAMEELALRMAQCDRLYRAGDMFELRKSSRTLIAIAEQVGMRLVARVANDVVTCIDGQDPVALAATLSRMMRAGEGSLTAIWDLQDLII